MADEKPVPATIEVPPEVAYRQALANPMVPKIYANTFNLLVQPTDIALLLAQAGHPNAIISMTYPVAKTLSARLQQAVESYEKLAAVSIPEAETLEKKYRDNQPQS